MENRACGGRFGRWLDVSSQGQSALPRRSSLTVLLFGSRAQEFLSSRGDSLLRNGVLCSLALFNRLMSYAKSLCLRGVPCTELHSYSASAIVLGL